MNFALRALLTMLIAGIGINSLNFRSLTEYFTPAAMIVIIIAVVGAFIGACIFGHITGLFGYEAGVTAGLCCCNIGGSGDLAVFPQPMIFIKPAECSFYYPTFRDNFKFMQLIAFSHFNNFFC